MLHETAGLTFVMSGGEPGETSQEGPSGAVLKGGGTRDNAP